MFSILQKNQSVQHTMWYVSNAVEFRILSGKLKKSLHGPHNVGFQVKHILTGFSYEKNK